MIAHASRSSLRGRLALWRPRNDDFIERRGSLLARTMAAISEHGTLALLAGVSLFPLYLMIVASLHAGTDFNESSIAPPASPTLDNYVTSWTDLGFGRMLLNSAVLSTSSALLCALLGVCAAYGFTRFRFRGRGAILGVVIASMAVPAVVIIVPIFVLFSDLGLIDTYIGGIAVEAGLLLPFSTFLLYSYLRDLPTELFESADVDGASTFMQFYKVALPLSRPALVTTATIAAIFAWNDLLVPLVLWQSEDLTTLMVGLASIGPGRTGVQDIPLLMAAVTVSILPLLVVFLGARRALLRGLTEGSDR